MRSPITVRQLTREEHAALEQGLRSGTALTMRRSQILLASARGEHAPAISRVLGCSDQTVRKAIHAFEQRGIAALQPGAKRPHRLATKVTDEQAKAVVALVQQSPRTFQQETSVWTLDLLVHVSLAQGVLQERVTGETIRQVLKRLGIQWKRAKHWITSPDPAYARKKTHGTAC